MGPGGCQSHVSELHQQPRVCLLGTLCTCADWALRCICVSDLSPAGVHCAFPQKETQQCLSRP